MCVLALVNLFIGERILIEFTPPDSQARLKFQSCVRNASGDNYGIEFILTNDNDYRNVGQLDYALKKFQAGSR